MIPILTLLYLLALIAFVLATIGTSTRVNLVALGLALVTGAWLLSGSWPRG